MDENVVAGLRSAHRRSGRTVREAWLAYLALGGNADEVSVAGQLHGLVALDRADYDVLAHAVNEALDDLPDEVRGPRAAYLRAGLVREARERGPGAG